MWFSMARAWFCRLVTMCGGSAFRKGLCCTSCVYSSGAGASSASISLRMLVLPLMMMDSVSRPRQVPCTCSRLQRFQATVEAPESSAKEGQHSIGVVSPSCMGMDGTVGICLC